MSHFPSARRNDPKSLGLRTDVIKRTNLKLWRPYLSERQRGTVREDYSADADAWRKYFHVENGKGLGTSNQTGWTSLVSRFIKKANRVAD